MFKFYEYIFDLIISAFIEVRKLFYLTKFIYNNWLKIKNLSYSRTRANVIFESTNNVC